MVVAALKQLKGVEGYGDDNIDIVVEARGLKLGALPAPHVVGNLPLAPILEAVYHGAP